MIENKENYDRKKLLKDVYYLVLQSITFAINTRARVKVQCCLNQTVSCSLITLLLVLYL